MSRERNSVSTGRTCTKKWAESCKGRSPEFKHWPLDARLERPNNADPGLEAVKRVCYGYCIMCHDCFDRLWAGEN